MGKFDQERQQRAANNSVNTNNTNTMPINHSTSVDMTQDFSLATGFRMYENVTSFKRSRSSSEINASARFGKLTSTYHGMISLDTKADEAFGYLRPLPEKMSSQPGYHAIIELLFPNGQTRKLSQAETIEFWASMLGLDAEDDIPLFRIQYKLDGSGAEFKEFLVDGSVGALVFEFNDINSCFVQGKNAFTQGSGALESVEELRFYPARGFHSITIAETPLESSANLLGIKLPKVLVDEDVVASNVVGLESVSKSSVRRPGRKARHVAAVVASVAPIAEPIVEPIVEEAPCFDDVDDAPCFDEEPAAQTSVAVESAEVANDNNGEATNIVSEDSPLMKHLRAQEAKQASARANAVTAIIDMDEE